MLKLSRTKKNACLALAVAATILGGGSVFAAEHDKAIVEADYYGDAHRSYWEAQKISNGKGWDNNTYTFTEDTVLKPNASEATYCTDGSRTYNFRGIFKSGNADSIIDMTGHRLDVAMNYDNPGGNRPYYLNLFGISVTGGHLNIKNVHGMDLSAKGAMMTDSSNLTGIYVAGTRNPDEGKANLTIENGEGWDNAIKFHAQDSGASYIERGIYVWKNTGTANLTISGLVDIDTGASRALYVNGGYSGYQGNAETVASIGGGRLKSTGTAIYDNGGSVFINSSLVDNTIAENAVKQDVQIDGDVIVKDAASNYNPSDNGILTLALNTKDSYLNGTIYTNASEWGKNANGDAYIALKNGATWTNEAKGSSHGTNLVQFAGGDSAANTGYIFQKDSGALNLGSYSGSTTIFYAHDNAGTETSDYTAGNTTITTAKAGSNITLVTDNVDTNNDATVKAALNALAGKLYYTGIKNGENTLEGTAAIAEGLTSSSKYLKTSSIYFDEENGQGTTTSSGNQTKTSFTTTLTGNNASDTEYEEGGVIAEDGSYKFDKATTITTNSNAINVAKNMSVVADKTLTLNVKNPSSTGHGINITGDNEVKIKAGLLKMDLSGTGINSEGLQGIRTTSTDSKLTIDGDVDITANGDNNTIGIYSRGNVTIDGNVKLDIEGNGGGYQYYGATGLYATSSMGSTKGGIITVNGNVDFYGNANGLWSNAGGGEVNVKGGSIIVKDGQTKGYAAIKAENGTINMNVVKDASGNVTGADTNDVTIKGNLSLDPGAVNSSDIHGAKSEINLGLTTENSSLTGVVQNSFKDEGNVSGNMTFTGAANIWLQNGATWNNEIVDTIIKVPYNGIKWAGSHVAKLIGGNSDATAGSVFQKDSDNLTIDNYSGNTNIYYAHDGNGEAAENYTAGDTIIKSAAADSVVSLITDNSNVAMDNSDSVANVLNALAGKLTYSNFVNGENNLTGYVKIADGLTASSKAMKAGDITFTDTGKGSYVKTQIVEKSEFTTSLTGKAANDEEYQGNIDSDGTYFFTKDSTITTNNTPNIEVANSSLNIKADSDLTLVANEDGTAKEVNAIKQRAGQTVNIKAKNLNVKAGNTAGETYAVRVASGAADKRASLTIDGNLNMDINGSGGAHTIGAYSNQSDLTINGDVKSTLDAGIGTNVYYGAAHLYATSAQGDQAEGYKGGRLVVNGDVDLSGNGQGLFANIGGAEVTVNGGGKISVSENKDMDNGYAAIRAEDGTVNMNVKLGNGTATSGLGKDVNIQGNITASVGAVNDVDTAGKLTTINLALDTDKSTLHGALVNGFDRPDGTTGVTTDAGNKFNGAINLYLQNGAEWNNELYGNVKFYSGLLYQEGFQGSHAANFTGGSDAAHTGYIIQNDDKKLTIDNYSGYTTVFYSHTTSYEDEDSGDIIDGSKNNGTEAGHYFGGDTVIKNAAKDSNITLVTDNANIDTANNDQVAKVLNTLAGKLFYNAYVTGERNLSGTVSIADGLTASSFTKTYNSGDITFKENGQGSYSEKEPEKPVQTEFTSQIQGTADRDTEYVEAGITTGDQKYTFTKDSTITVGNKDAILGVAEIDADWVTTFSKSFKGITVDAGDNTLTLNTNQRAIYANGNSKSGIVSNITAGKLAITANETNAYRDAAFAVATGGVTLNVNADIEGTAYGTTSNTYGLYAEKGSTLNVNGNITAVKDDGYGINGANTSKVYGIRANDGTVTVNGGVNMTVNGTAVAADKGTVSINMNADKSEAAANDVILTGSVTAKDGAGTVNLGMSTDKSKLTGSANGNVNLWLQNGASWDNTGASSVAKLAGGASEAAAGNIFANGALTIANYSGNTNIFYAHTGNGEAASDYAAGDTTITSAAEGSVVSMITDNTGISMDSEDSVANVLNALAGKLFYTNFATGEKNLTGYVKIADGLTASSKALKAEDITFTENGQGSYVKPGPTIPDHQVTTEFKTTLTGDSDKDQEYLMGGVIAADGTYKFTEASDITAVNAIDAAKDLKIVADKTLSVTADKGIALNVTNAAAKNVDITAEKLVLKTTSSNGALQAGTYTSKATVNITGDVDVTATNNNNVYGIYATNADITVTGDVKAVVDGGQGGYNYAGVSAISAQGSSYRKYASTVTVNGDVDITANGNGLQANGNGATVTVNGGGVITINDSNSKGYSALRADNGTVNMNVALTEGKATAGLGKDVVVKGNLAATNGAGDSAASIVNVAFDTEKSSLEGVAYTAGSNSSINLWLQNGASWTNEVHDATEKDWQQKDIFTGSSVASFVGGTSDATAGNIFQKDSNNLTIANYSGNTNIFYAHTGNGEAASDYAAGDTTITSAAEGSVVSMITDSTGVEMNNEGSVKNVLNALAGKLTYSNFTNGEENLTGYVKIADGLTASSKSMQAGDISFSKDDGKGSLKDGTLTPGFKYPDEQPEDKKDLSQGITGDDKLDNGFKQDGILKADGKFVFTQNPTEIKVTEGAAVSAGRDIDIDSSKAKLVLTGVSEGIKADGHSVNILGSTEISGETAISANNGDVTLNGITKITGENAAINAANGANVNISGGAATITGDLNADDASIKLDGGKTTSEIKGDLNVANNGNIDITLNEKNSTLTGGYNVEDGNLNLAIQNGATWNVGSMAGDGLNITGGATQSATGYIVIPSASSAATYSLRAAAPATSFDIANYSGWETIVYAHDNAGADVSDYTGVDTVIRKAAAGSGVVLSTDNSGIDMKSKDAVEATLKALAQKVTYSDHEANADNLTGKVQIADGLTASSVSKNIGDMTWAADGKGQYVDDSVNWSAIASGEITEGDYETFVMKGVRSAATTSLHTWRDNMQDTYTGADLADEDGIFAKALGGKTSSDVKGLKDSNTYYGIQVGYDKAAGNGWHTGVAFDYRDGDSNYLLGGKGDNQMYSLGVYGVKNFENNAFFRVAAKVGRVENEYDVYNEIRSLKLHGDYKSNAYGLTMEYGRTFGDEETYFTPKAQLTWAQVGSKNYSAYTDNGARMDVDQDSYSSFVGRLGFEAGVKSEKGRVYAGLFAAHEFNGDIGASYFANDGDRKHTSFDGEDTWMEMKLGGTYDFSKVSHFYADIAKDFGGDFERKWKLNAGVRFEF